MEETLERMERQMSALTERLDSVVLHCSAAAASHSRIEVELANLRHRGVSYGQVKGSAAREPVQDSKATQNSEATQVSKDMEAEVTREARVAEESSLKRERLMSAFSKNEIFGSDDDKPDEVDSAPVDPAR